jgi:hypothetical protein
MVLAQITVDDLASSYTGRLALNEFQGNRVEITGLDLLNGRNSPMSEYLANMDFSDDSSFSDGSFAKDSLDLTGNGMRGKMTRRLSNDSYANDSVEVAKNKKLRIIAKNKQIQITLQTQKVQIPKNMKLSTQQMAVKNIAIPFSSVSPDLAGLRQMKISNHAA